MKKILLLTLISLSTLFSAPTSSWYMDELGRASYQYSVDDAAGDNEGLTYAIPSTTSGKICSALDFRANGTSDYVTLDKNALNGAGDFTVSVWTKQSSKAGKALISGARSGQYNEFILWFSSDTRMYGYLDGKSNGGVTVPSIADNQWHHIAWRRNGSESCLFTDGVKRGCKTVTTKALVIDSLIVGQEQDTLGGGFDGSQDWEGLVDEMLFFKDQALSDAEITSIYNNQKSGKSWNGGTRSCDTVSMDGYTDWHFDEASWNGSANEIKDSHGSNDGQGFNVTATAGKLCNAIDLRQNSNSDYAKLGAGAIDKIGDFTLSLWQKGTSGTDSHALLSGAKSSEDNELLFWFTNPTRFVPHLHGATQYLNISNIDDGSWHHIVWRRLGHENCFFRDGNKEGCLDRGSFSLLTIQSLILGQDQDNVGGAFDVNQDWEGIVDELLIFRRAFSDSEISSIYNNQNSGRNWDGSSRVCPAAIMSLHKTSCIINDLINGTSSPKRIPGATIRYAVEVKNEGSATANNVIITDTVADKFDPNTIKNLQIQSNSCDCLGVSSASNNGANGSSNGENPVKLDFDTIAGGSESNPTVKCGYFEVDIR